MCFFHEAFGFSDLALATQSCYQGFYNPGRFLIGFVIVCNMFFLIGGIQPKTVVLEKQAGACPVCAHTGISIKRVDQYLSLFFIPLFRIKRGVPAPMCDHCKSILDADQSGGYYKTVAKEKKCSRCARIIHDEEFFYCPYCGNRL
jgi:RNA polymerase subunit RPABC4/transcription elongation factor Spt4